MKAIKIILAILLGMCLLSCSVCNSDKARRSGKRYVLYQLDGKIDSVKGKRIKALYVDSTKICNYKGSKTTNDLISLLYYKTKYQNEFFKQLN